MLNHVNHVDYGSVASVVIALESVDTLFHVRPFTNLIKMWAPHRDAIEVGTGVKFARWSQVAPCFRHSPNSDDSSQSRKEAEANLVGYFGSTVGQILARLIDEIKSLAEAWPFKLSRGMLLYRSRPHCVRYLINVRFTPQRDSRRHVLLQKGSAKIGRECLAADR